MSYKNRFRLRILLYIIGFLILIFIVPALMHGAPTPTPKPKFTISDTEVKKIPFSDILKTMEHQAQRIDAVIGENEKLRDDAIKQAQTLATTQSTLAATQKSFGDYQLSVQSIVDKANKAIAALDHVLAKLHLAKIIATALLAAGCALVALRIPPPAGFYLAGALFVVGTGLIWWLL